MGPPSLANISRCDRLPLSFAFKSHIREELSRLCVQKDGIVFHSMFEQRFLQLWPNLPVAPLVFRFVARVHRHDECFSDHAGIESQPASDVIQSMPDSSRSRQNRSP